VKNFVGLALVLPLVACSGQPSYFGDDAGNPVDDAGNPVDDAGNPVDDAGNPPPPTNAPLATGLAITDIAVYQAVKVTVVKNGAQASKNAPVVAGRDGLVRVFVKPAAPFTHAITGVLTLTTGGTPHVVTATLTPKAQSTDAAFTSTFNFNVTGANFGTDTTYLVQLKDPQGTGTGDTSAQFPTSGSATSLGVQSSGPDVQIKLFPINFTSGGSTPATGGIDVAAYQRMVQALYPTPKVTVTVMPAISYSGSIPSADGSVGWNSLLNYMIQKRSADSSKNVYYYGGFAPTSSFASYCSGGCVAGLSSIPSSPSNSQMKASIGLMYGGNSLDQMATGQTMAHEVGHGHGRSHSPTSYNIQGCSQPSGIDPSYPYANGGINTWGYDVTAGKPIDPSQYYDMMGYCEYDWISDYTYKALFSWIASDNGADMLGQMSPGTYRMVTVDGTGAIVDVSAPTPVYGAVSGDAHTIKITDNLGVVHTVTGYYSPYDHIAGGLFWVPESAFSIGTLAIPDFGNKAVIKLH
jgi:hypothetical protein